MGSGQRQCVVCGSNGQWAAARGSGQQQWAVGNGQWAATMDSGNGQWASARGSGQQQWAVGSHDELQNIFGWLARFLNATFDMDCIYGFQSSNVCK